MTRRHSTGLTPFVSTPLFATPGFPTLSQAAEEFTARANEMMRAAVSGFPEFPAAGQFPALNLSESKDEFTVTAELPGMTDKDVSIDYCDGVLTIRGEKEEEQTKEEDDRKYYLWERRFGSFQRVLPFPGGIDATKIVAEFKNGVLSVHVPKSESAKAKHNVIPIVTK
jgi:HSP20 family protein